MKLSARFVLMTAMIALRFSVHAQWATPDNSKIVTNCTTPPCLVGIGTTTPYARLHVFGQAGPASLVKNTPAVLSVMGSNNVDLTMGTDTAGPYAAWIQAKHNTIDSSYPLTLQPAGGNVGIGTTNPNHKLTVQSTLDGLAKVIVSTPMAANFAVNSSIGGLRLTWKHGGAPSNDVDLQVIRGYDGTDGAGFAVATSPNNATAPIERLRVTSAGNVGIGVINPTERLHVNGNIHVTGNINAKYQDVAEWVPAASDLEAGTVVVLNPARDNEVMASNHAYDTTVAGVVSAQPGLTLGEQSSTKETIATMGRVKVRVDASRAAIAVGDLLVTSDQSGVAMKSIPVELGGFPMHRPGTIIGKALQPLTGGTGEILVLLSMQ